MQPSSTAVRQTAAAVLEGRMLTRVLDGTASQAMAPDNRNGEQSDCRTWCPSHASPVLSDGLHELANAVTAVLINAQVLEWKLPPYSRLKRLVREIERHAQRGGALLQRLLHQFESTNLCPQLPVPGAVAAGPGFHFPWQRRTHIVM